MIVNLLQNKYAKQNFKTLNIDERKINKLEALIHENC